MMTAYSLARKDTSTVGRSDITLGLVDRIMLPAIDRGSVRVVAGKGASATAGIEVLGIQPGTGPRACTSRSWRRQIPL